MRFLLIRVWESATQLFCMFTGATKITLNRYFVHTNKNS